MKVKSSNNSSEIKAALFNLSKYSRAILHIGLPTVLFYFSVLLYSILSSDLPGYILSRKYFDALEHVVMSATLIVIGAILTDILDTSQKRQGR